jgi:hypothetical protein
MGVPPYVLPLAGWCCSGCCQNLPPKQHPEVTACSCCPWTCAVVGAGRPTAARSRPPSWTWTPTCLLLCCPGCACMGCAGGSSGCWSRLSARGARSSSWWVGPCSGVTPVCVTSLLAGVPEQRQCVSWCAHRSHALLGRACVIGLIPRQAVQRCVPCSWNLPNRPRFSHCWHLGLHNTHCM